MDDITSSPPSDSAASGSASGASKFLANLPSRDLFSSTVVSSNPVGMRVNVCQHNTSPPDYQSLTVERLRVLLKEKGLSIKGRKEELIARLRGMNG